MSCISQPVVKLADAAGNGGKRVGKIGGGFTADAEVSL